MYHSKSILPTSLLLICLFGLLLACAPREHTSPKTSQANALNRSDGNGITKSYIITNRNDPGTKDTNSLSEVIPIPNGGLTWWESNAGPNDTVPSNYNQVSDATSFLKDLAKDLNQVAQNDVASVTVFIHGLSTSWYQARRVTGYYGTALANEGYENGVVVGFSWPSYASMPDFSDDPILGVAELPWYALSYPPTSTKGNLRDNINGSCPAFKAMMDSLFNLANHGLTVGTLQINVVAHSEGGTMAMYGMNYVAANGGFNNKKLVNHTLLLAPDINDAALQSPTTTVSATGNKGDGGAIADLSNAVTLYYSPHDPVLLGSTLLCALTTDIGLPTLHNPNYPVRLGLLGPEDPYLANPKLTSINCGPMNNSDRMSELSEAGVLVYPDSSTHVSYLSDPGIISDQVYALTGNASTYTEGGTRNADGSTLFDRTFNYCLKPQEYIVDQYNTCSLTKDMVEADFLNAEVCQFSLDSIVKAQASARK